jgi:predicted transcriptional regulator
MASELSPDKDAVIDRLVATGFFPGRQQALDHAVELLREEAETVEAIREGLASIERGEGVPLEEAIKALRQKYQIPDDA